MRNCIHPPTSPADEVVYVNGTGDTIAGGTVVLAGDTYLALTGDVADGSSVVGYAAGRFTLAKPTGGSTALVLGQLVGFNTGTQQTIKAPANADLVLGRVAVAAGDSDATVEIDILPSANKSGVPA
jgi:predicted RecA/RadA family phage recombinase